MASNSLLTRFILILDRDQDYMWVLETAQDYSFEILELERFEIEFFDRSDFKLMHHMLKRRLVSHRLVFCYN